LIAALFACSPPKTGSFRAFQGFSRIPGTAGPDIYLTGKIFSRSFTVTMQKNAILGSPKVNITENRRSLVNYIKNQNRRIKMFHFTVCDYNNV
jgi:hypothetical protein